MTVKVVTDSTSDLTPEEAAAVGVTVVPLIVHFGGRSYLDRVEITPQEFFRRLTSEGVLPKTSQPSVGAFAETYERLLREGATAIVSIHISGKLSGTVNAARAARDALPEPARVVVVDSETVTAPLAYGVRAAAAAKGPDQRRWRRRRAAPSVVPIWSLSWTRSSTSRRADASGACAPGWAACSASSRSSP